YYVGRASAGTEGQNEITFGSERFDLPREDMLYSVVIAYRGQYRGIRAMQMAGQAFRSRSNRPTNSAAICWASAALPPFPRRMSFPPDRKHSIIQLAAVSICSTMLESTDCLTAMLSLRQSSIVDAMGREPIAIT